MTVSEWPAGKYVLQHTVENPDGDRRHKHDWRKAPLWSKGKVFWVTFEHVSGRATRPLVYAGRFSFQVTHLHLMPEEFRANLAKSAPVNLAEAVRDAGYEGHLAANVIWYRALELLIEAGKITQEDVIGVLKEKGWIDAQGV